MRSSLNRLDLNLLRVFDAVLEERSVLRAGQRVCLSQSAVSHALARLREVLDDELFIRTPTGMHPTARALAMAPLLRDAWKSLETAIRPPKFEPHTSDRRFTIAVNDLAAMVMVSNLLNLSRQEAPYVELVVRSDSRINLAEQIDLGRVDAAIGIFSDIPPRFKSNALFCYDDVLITSSSSDIGYLTLEKLSDLTIATVCLQGEDEADIDELSADRCQGLRSETHGRVALRKAFSDSEQSPRLSAVLPHFMSILPLLEDGDLAAIVPRPLGKLQARTRSVSMHELPYKTDSTEVRILWHERNSEDVSQYWLRGLLKRATQHLRPEFSALETGTQSAQMAPHLLTATDA
jgi:DNA-binding transcriptional LysR family regulator